MKKDKSGKNAGLRISFAMLRWVKKQNIIECYQLHFVKICTNWTVSQTVSVRRNSIASSGNPTNALLLSGLNWVSETNKPKIKEVEKAGPLQNHTKFNYTLE